MDGSTGANRIKPVGIAENGIGGQASRTTKCFSQKKKLPLE
jgi:hypothetical protein